LPRLPRAEDLGQIRELDVRGEIREILRGVRFERERGRDAEVAAASTSDRPEEIRFVRGVAREHATVRGHDLRALIRSGATDDQLAAKLAEIWHVRGDRYSELRSQNTVDPAIGERKVEMSYLGG